MVSTHQAPFRHRLTRDDVLGAAPDTATEALVHLYRDAAERRPVAAGIAALYAYERQVPAVATAKIDGLRRHYGLDDDRTLAFFRVQSTLDEDHAGAEARIIEALGGSDADVVVDTATDALDAWWSFLDGVDQG